MAASVEFLAHRSRESMLGRWGAGGRRCVFAIDSEVKRIRMNTLVKGSIQPLDSYLTMMHSTHALRMDCADLFSPLL